MCPEFGENLPCAAHLSSDGRNVTLLAAWTTSNSSIAIVNRRGAVTVLGTGEVTIRATYQGITGVYFAWAVAGDGLHGTSRDLWGAVQGSDGPFVTGVVMEILDGPNAGRMTTTSFHGEFFMDGLQDGPFTIRLSKPGYVTAEYVWRIPGGSRRSPVINRAPG